MEENGLPAGVRTVAHTADLALEVDAGALPQLFDRAAAGMFHLIEGEDDVSRECAGERDLHSGAPASVDVEVHDLKLRAADLPSLLVQWLRELLHLHQVRRLAYQGAEFSELTSGSLQARIRAMPAPGTDIREIKGITYHALEVARRGPRWYARVVFDV